jgi:hypothetical protein
LAVYLADSVLRNNIFRDNFYLNIKISENMVYAHVTNVL